MGENSPPTIGPYRILRRLGVGGMGEVFLAHDPRLGREVAIKRIKPGTEARSEHRERFRREARLAAGLNHAAIVQIHDFLATDTAEHLVMEYVAGIGLRELLEQGPLSLVRGLRVASDVASGLSYAHAHGVVHRDLKTENVLLDTEGRAKIADFGIARWLEPPEDGSGDEPLTRTGAIVGTCRAMSPEQACGDAVDARSDLFSFGVLLYEMFTGESPFLADSRARTLQRILSHRQRPASEVDSRVPPELAELIDHLLEKDPALRVRDAAEVVDRLAALTAGWDDGTTRAAETTGVSSAPAASAVPNVADSSASTRSGSYATGRLRSRFGWIVGLVAGLAIIWVVTSRSPPPPALHVAVLEPEIQAAGPPGGEVELLAFAIRNALVRALVSLQGLSPKTTAEVDAADGPPTAVARAVAADALVTAAIACQARSCLVEVSRIRADGGVEWSEEIRVPLDEPLTAARAVTFLLRQGFASHSLSSGFLDLEVTPEDYVAYLDIRRSFGADAENRIPHEVSLERLAAIRARSARFVDAYLLEAYVATRRFYETRESAMIDHALRLLDQSQVLEPGNPDVWLRRGAVELAAGRLEEAETTMSEIDGLAPGDSRALDLRARLLERRGEPAQALELYRTAVLRKPSWQSLYNYGTLAYRLGKIDLARETLEALLVRAPRVYQGLSFLAQLELVNGEPARAKELYLELASRSPGPTELTNLAVAHLLLGEYAASAVASERALEVAPDNPFFVLNLADARWLEGEVEKAAELYRRTLVLLEADPAATTWQHLTVRAQALAHLGEHRQAVTAVQEALGLAREGGPVAFEAALVYALTGDDTPALVNAERAVASGRSRWWFRLPWFEHLQSRLVFEP